jgi:hypothetical protein
VRPLAPSLGTNKIQPCPYQIGRRQVCDSHCLREQVARRGKLLPGVAAAAAQRHGRRAVEVDARGAWPTSRRLADAR